MLPPYHGFLHIVSIQCGSKLYIKYLWEGGALYIVDKNGVNSQITELPSYFSTRVRGTAMNDVFVVGAFGLCGHFNGISWKNYPEVSLPDGSYEGLAVSENLIVAVGFAGSKAVVLRGYRK